MIGQWAIADNDSAVPIESAYVESNYCVLCDSVQASTNGLAQHISMVHDAKLKRIVICDVCGKEKYRGNSVATMSDVQYCSKSCESQHKTGRDVPDDHNFRKDGKNAYACDYCGDTIMKYPSVAAQNERNFCDKECHRKWQSECRPSEHHNWWQGGPAQVECAVCGESLERKPSMAELRDRHFCSTECEGEWKRENQTGPNHPNWKGEYAKGYYGPNWEEQRENRLKHDEYECVVCGLSQEEHNSRYGRGLEIHHIDPIENYRDGRDLDWKAANRLENLLTVCRPCHSKWEGVPVRPQVGDDT